MALPDHPNNRYETYLAKIAGQAVEVPDHPITREEAYLDEIAKNGGGGGGSEVTVEQIKTSGEKIATITVDGEATDLYASAGGSGGGAVDTVNGKTGDVVLDAHDVGALPDNTHIPADQIQSDWEQSDNTKKDYIKNKPTIPDAQIQADWNQSDDTKKDYIKNKPTVPAAQVNADWTASSGVSEILHKPTLGTAAAKNVPASGNAGNDEVVLGNDSRLSDARNAADVSSWAKAANKPTYTASEVGAIASTEKGANNGVATLGSDGKVPSSQLPSISGGHTIEDADGTAMTARNNLQFTGSGVSVTDDSTNNRTVISIETVNTFTIATSAWVANTGSDAAAFPYVAEITTALYSSMFVPCEVLLLGADPSDYPTSTDETAISMVDKYIKFTGTAIRLRATDAPATSLTLVVRG